MINLIRCIWQYMWLHILNMPNFVSGMGELSEALRLSPRTRLVSAGSITPSSHNLQISLLKLVCTIFKRSHILDTSRLQETAPCAWEVRTALHLKTLHNWFLKRLFLLCCPRLSFPETEIDWLFDGIIIDVSCSLSFFFAPLWLSPKRSPPVLLPSRWSARSATCIGNEVCKQKECPLPQINSKRHSLLHIKEEAFKPTLPISPAAHSIVASPIRTADDECELGNLIWACKQFKHLCLWYLEVWTYFRTHLCACYGSYQFGAVLGNAAGFSFSPNHKAGNILKIERWNDETL